MNRYLKMQLKAFPSATASLAFDNLAPRETSTRHVAAAAFYHCLGAPMSAQLSPTDSTDRDLYLMTVLSTKDLIGIAQNESYGTIQLSVK